jgi:hypothetical protein
MKLVSVFTAFNPLEAQLIRARLETAGLHAVVTHELSALSIDGYSMAAGGIRVQVPDTEVADARALIDAATESPPNETPDA